MEEKIFNKLYKLSKKAGKKSESPVSAIIVNNTDNKIIAKAYNKRNKTNLTISHAEIEVISKANKKLKSWRLNNCTLYITMEPCAMCKSVIREARIKYVYYLIKKEPIKKQYNKTEFNLIDFLNSNDIKNKYLKDLSNFWEMRRKNK
ncbi:MAG: nucleoside deaminase [Bacilli bacterium]|nr:nucleoside deaminase [Bacilli bacterium]